MIKGSFGIRGEEGKDHREDFGLNGEMNGLFEGREIVFIKAEDEGSPDRDPETMQGVDDLPILRWIVLGFVGVDQIRPGEGFKPNQKTQTPAPGEEFERLGFF